MVTVMEGPQIGPFNVGNPGEFTMLELANLVKEVRARLRRQQGGRARKCTSHTSRGRRTPCNSVASWCCAHAGGEPQGGD